MAGTYIPKVYRDKGGDRQVVGPGGILKLDGLFTLHGLEIPAGFDEVWYVDGQNGSATNDGKDMDNPLLTTQAAIDLNNATIDWAKTPKRYNAILVAPAVYAENLTPPYYCHIIGMGVRGTDTQAEIHPATGSGFTGTFLGTCLHNIRLEVDEGSKPILDLGICNNSLIEDCTFTIGADVAGVDAIDTENCTHLTVRRCNFESGMATHGIKHCLYFRGGADKYAHNVRILGNVMHCQTAGVYIASNCVATQCTIAHNFIMGPTKGIDDNNGASWCIGNWISATDAIEHANSATRCIGNHVINDGTGAVEASGTD